LDEPTHCLRTNKSETGVSITCLQMTARRIRSVWRRSGVLSTWTGRSPTWIVV